jgi:hypothetical protein
MYNKNKINIVIVEARKKKKKIFEKRKINNKIIFVNIKNNKRSKVAQIICYVDVTKMK